MLAIKRQYLMLFKLLIDCKIKFYIVFQLLSRKDLIAT